jgi:hypothetical protein
MTGRGLPARVADGAWQDWLQGFPPAPRDTLGAAMRYNRELSGHMELMPDPGRLTAYEQRQVGDDLAHYARILQGLQEASLWEAWVALGGSAGSLAAKLYFPGAEILLLALAAGLGMVALGRVYDIKRRQRIINRLIQRIDALSWQLKG